MSVEFLPVLSLISSAAEIFMEMREGRERREIAATQTAKV
jgi:hypothetical protein